MKTSDLTGAALDWAVWACEKPDDVFLQQRRKCRPYSTDWSQGGPIIEREKIGFKYTGTAMEFVAWLNGELSTKHDCYGPTPLVAAMRCFVASRLGDEVNIPEKLV